MFTSMASAFVLLGASPYVLTRPLHHSQKLLKEDETASRIGKRLQLAAAAYQRPLEEKPAS